MDAILVSGSGVAAILARSRPLTHTQAQEMSQEAHGAGEPEEALGAGEEVPIPFVYVCFC